MDDVELVRRHCETYEGVDFVPRIAELLEQWQRADTDERRERLRVQDPALSMLSPDVEVRVHAGPEPTEGRGLETIMRFFAEWYALWETYIYEIEAYSDLGGGATLTKTHVHGRGRTGIPVEMTAFELRRVSGGLIVSWEIFESEQAALRALESQETSL